jgi:hypothetical protein
LENRCRPWRFRIANSSGSNAKKKNPPYGGRRVQLRHSQQNLGEVFFAREAASLMEAWMKEVDEILAGSGLRAAGAAAPSEP